MTTAAVSEAIVAYDLANRAVPEIAPPLPPLLRRLEMEMDTPPNWSLADEADFHRACRLAMLSNDEARLGWIVLRGYQRALRRAECDLGLPELDAVRRRASVDYEEAWTLFIAAPSPDLHRALRKFELVQNRGDDREAIEAVYKDFSRNLGDKSRDK